MSAALRLFAAQDGLQSRECLEVEGEEPDRSANERRIGLAAEGRDGGRGPFNQLPVGVLELDENAPSLPVVAASDEVARREAYTVRQYSPW